MKKTDEDHPMLKKLLERGIPVKKAVFVADIDNAKNTPQSQFNKESSTVERHVKMWWINGDGLLCQQEDIKGEDQYFFVPSSIVKFVKFE